MHFFEFCFLTIYVLDLPLVCGRILARNTLSTVMNESSSKSNHIEFKASSLWSMCYVVIFQDAEIAPRHVDYAPLSPYFNWSGGALCSIQLGCSSSSSPSFVLLLLKIKYQQQISYSCTHFWLFFIVFCWIF